MDQKHGDGLMDKTLTVILITALIAGAATSFYLIQNGYPLMETLTAIPAKASQLWSSIPQIIRDIIKIGIPSAFAMFFAWTKLRVVDQAKQAQQTLTAQLTQVEGEKAEAQAIAEASSVKGLEKILAERDAAVASRDEATALVGQLQSKVTSLEKGYATIDHSLQTVRSPTVPEMKRRLEQEGFTVKQKVA